ncbi:MAG: sugar ABC transporter ATP-binding protein [Gaiellaceae bacterium]
MILTPERNGPAHPRRPGVEAAGVSKRFGSTVALDDVQLVVTPGETHALVGRNGAGKSTLVSILTGLDAADAGTLTFSGEPAPQLADRDAWRRLVACVYQKSTIIPTLTAAENLYLNRQSATRSLINWKRMRAQATALLQEWELEIDVRTPAQQLTVEQCQLIEIARALSFGARFVILDEPTAQLDGAAIERLFERIRRLQEQGVTFLYISHHLQEIYEICDTVTVLRDAQHIVTKPVAELPTEALVRAMTGDVDVMRADQQPPAVARGGAGAVLRVSGLTNGDEYTDVSFTVNAGEVVGLAGNTGSGKVAVAERIAGLRSAESGTVEVNGTVTKPGSVPSALAAGVGLVPRDRHHEGFVPLLSIAENATMTIANRLVRHGLIDRRRRDAVTRRLIDELSIKTPGPELPVSALSGGNQQKIVMARALAGDPKVLVLISPTAGIDVRSKQVLLDAVSKARSSGTGVLVVSDDLDELRACDRVLVMFQQRIVREMTKAWQDHEVVAAMEGVLDD